MHFLLVLVTSKMLTISVLVMHFIIFCNAQSFWPFQRPRLIKKAGIPTNGIKRTSEQWRPIKIIGPEINLYSPKYLQMLREMAEMKSDIDTRNDNKPKYFIEEYEPYANRPRYVSAMKPVRTAKLHDSILSENLHKYDPRTTGTTEYPRRQSYRSNRRRKPQMQRPGPHISVNIIQLPEKTLTTKGFSMVRTAARAAMNAPSFIAKRYRNSIRRMLKRKRGGERNRDNNKGFADKLDRNQGNKARRPGELVGSDRGIPNNGYSLREIYDKGVQNINDNSRYSSPYDIRDRTGSPVTYMPSRRYDTSNQRTFRSRRDQGKVYVYIIPSVPKSRSIFG